VHSIPNTGFVILGVFDGTVGDFVADELTRIFVPTLIMTHTWREFLALPESADEEKRISLIESALRETFFACDSIILKQCEERGLDFCCSTAVVAIASPSMIVTAHIGDSRAALIHKQSGYVWGEFLTCDHRPDLPVERSRIEAAGGHVVYLASRDAQPFIRGGDFERRKQLGQQPMQVQYSRAFGGKDLKIFGLSAEPAVRVTNVTESEFSLILASDGLWDSLTASQAANLVVKAKDSPAESLVQHVLSTACDNVTAVVLIF
jgi:protein phosphatase